MTEPEATETVTSEPRASRLRARFMSCVDSSGPSRKDPWW